MYKGWFEARLGDCGGRAGGGEHFGAGVCRITERREYIGGTESVCRIEAAKVGGK
jgi:hypothetical protein